MYHYKVNVCILYTHILHLHAVGDSGVGRDTLILTSNILPLLTDFLNSEENNLIPEQIQVYANNLLSYLEPNQA